MTLGELITVLVDFDLSDPKAHDLPVHAEQADDGSFWIVVGEVRMEF